MSKDILTPEQVDECRSKGGPMPLSAGVVEYARRVVLLADSHEALREKVAALEAENAALRKPHQKHCASCVDAQCWGTRQPMEVENEALRAENSDLRRRLDELFTLSQESQP